MQVNPGRGQGSKNVIADVKKQQQQQQQNMRKHGRTVQDGPRLPCYSVWRDTRWGCRYQLYPMSGLELGLDGGGTHNSDGGDDAHKEDGDRDRGRQIA